MKDEIEFLRGLAMCDDKEQMMRYIQANAPKPPSRADSIRAMTDEELAAKLIFWDDDRDRWETDAGYIEGDPRKTQEKAIQAELAWLRQPAEEGGCDG